MTFWNVFYKVAAVNGIMTFSGFLTTMYLIHYLDRFGDSEYGERLRRPLRERNLSYFNLVLLGGVWWPVLYYLLAQAAWRSLSPPRR